MIEHDPTLDPPDDDYRHPDAMPSRASLALNVDRRHAEAQAERASHDATRRVLSPTCTVAHLGTQVGRMVTVERTAIGVQGRDAATRSHVGVLLQLGNDQAERLAVALLKAVAR